MDTDFIPVESEHSSMSAPIGAEAAGARSLTATSSAGLALMWEELLLAASNRMPLALTLVNRTLSGPININCDHSDGLGARDTGWIQIYAENNQEAYDNFIQAYPIAEDKRVHLPIMICQDGFITSHAVENIELLEDELVKDFVGEYEPEEYLLNPGKPIAVGPYSISNYAMEAKKNQEIAARLKKDMANLEKEKDEFKEKSQEEADAYLDKIHQEADQILKEIRAKQDTGKYHEALEAASRLNTMNEMPAKKDEVPANITYKVGDAVELRSSSTVCQIIKIEKKDITILINGREMRVKKNQIRPSVHVIPKTRPEITVNVKEQNIFATIPSEVNLIGMHVDEALEALDNYMDTVKLHGMKSFRVIHGDGTGKLRKAVHERLANEPGVKSFRLGMPNEGGTGATVVDLK